MSSDLERGTMPDEDGGSGRDRDPSIASLTKSRWRPSLLISFLVALAAVKVVLGLAGALVPSVAPSGEPRPATWIHVVHMLAFAGGALFFFARGERGGRARDLGLVFLAVAEAFSDALTLWFSRDLLAGTRSVAVLANCHVVAFLPWFAWRFFARFPNAVLFERQRRRLKLGTQVSLTIGAVLFAVNALGPVFPPEGPGPHWLQQLAGRSIANSGFWPLLFALTTLALAFGLGNLRRAPRDERRRVRLLLVGLLLGSAPMLVVVGLTELVPGLRAWALRPDVFPIAQAVVYIPLLTVPAVSVYAVQVHRALDVRSYAWKATRFGFARSSIVGAMVLPLIAATVALYSQRNQTVAELLTSPAGGAVIAAFVVGGVLLRWRERILEMVERRWFEDHHDALVTLEGLVGAVHQVGDLLELEALLTERVAGALHLEAVAVMTLDASGQVLVSHQHTAHPLRLDSALAQGLRESESLWDLDARPEPLSGLPMKDQLWLVDGGFRTLVPMRGSSGSLIGLLALGERRDDLPLVAPVQQVLSKLAGAVAAVAETRLLDLSPRPAIQANVAGECTECGAVVSAQAGSCAECAGAIGPANLPRLLNGKFRIEHRIGTGGMGVVYRAVDVELNRVVAVKTLTRMGTGLGWMLRREARAMAAVMHPNLALIFGAESYRGIPILVVEYLAGGTLRDRLAKGTLSVAEGLELGSAMAEASHVIHRRGILHRDIKPSNIGISAEGIPKLLDFGLAKVYERTEQQRRSGEYRGSALDRTSESLDPALAAASLEPGDGSSFGLVGTPEYMAPEAFSGAPPGPSFDLWSIAVVVFEAIAGTNPYRGPTVQNTFFRILQDAPNLRDWCPDVSFGLNATFKSLMAQQPAHRPSTGRALASRFRQMRSMIPGD